MDNSFKPQGEFQPDGEFKPQGEFNAPEQPRQFVDIEPAKAIKLPYAKSSKLALLSTVKGIATFIIGAILLSPSIISSAQSTIGSVAMLYLTFAFFVLSAICCVFAIFASIKGVQAKYTMAIWSMALSCVILLPTIILAVLCGQGGSFLI
ncbi:MAG: hypothetical protein PHE93_00470 [Clostridia bacterium]|nr:hypothetical protein [Clostridia bacterium]